MSCWNRDLFGSRPFIRGSGESESCDVNSRTTLSQFSLVACLIECFLQQMTVEANKKLFLVIRAVFHWVSKVIWNCFGFALIRSYPGCQRLFLRGFRFRCSLYCDPRDSDATGEKQTSGTQGTTLCDWFKNLAPPTQPIRCKTNRDLAARVFPRLTPVTCVRFEFSLVRFSVYVCCDCYDNCTLVLVLRCPIYNATSR